MFKRRLLLTLTVIVLALFAVSAVSANDNLTAASDIYNAKIVAKNMSEEYNPSGNDILFNIEDMEGNPIEDAKPTVTYDSRKVRAVYDSQHYYSKASGTYVLNLDPDAGNHKVKIVLNTSKYIAKPVFMNAKITKPATKMTLEKYVTTTKEYAILKARLKDKDNKRICEGKVKFKVNGKTYSVYVQNGVATKKIKLSKAGTYTYTATFTCVNYQKKSASSKLYVKQTKKYYTLKITNSKIHKTFTVKIPYKKYVYLLNAKNKAKFGYVHVDTGIKRPPEIGGGHYYVGMSTNDEYHTYYGYPIHDYVFLRSSSYLCLKKVNLYTTNF